MIHVPQIKTATIRQEGGRVQVIVNGKLAIDLPHDAALDLARAIHTKAKIAEEWASAQAIAHDQAILMRLGVPLGFTNHPAIIKEAQKEAAWNSELRRYIPPGRAKGIESQETFGAPIIHGGKRHGKKPK